MKHYYCIVAMMLALSSCYSPIHDNEETITETTEPTKAFTFHVKGDFTTNYEDMTRAAIRLEDNNTAGMTDLWVLDYCEDGTLVQQVHQSSTDDGFGSVPMNLTYGKHDIKFVASKGTSPSLTDNALSWTKAHDTFTLSYPVDVVASSNGNRAPELKRSVSGLKVIISDAIPANAKTIILTLGKRSQSLNLPDLTAATYSQSSVELDCTSNRGVSGASAAIYTLANNEEWTSSASITVKDAQGAVITSVTMPDVELRKNRMTTLTGEVFNRTNGFSVSIDNTWDNDLELTF